MVGRIFSAQEITSRSYEPKDAIEAFIARNCPTSDEQAQDKWMREFVDALNTAWNGALNSVVKASRASYCRGVQG